MYKKLEFKVGDRVTISKNEVLFRKGYKPQFTDEIFEFRQYLQKNPHIHHQRCRQRRNTGKIL